MGSPTVHYSGSGPLQATGCARIVPESARTMVPALVTCEPCLRFIRWTQSAPAGRPFTVTDPGTGRRKVGTLLPNGSPDWGTER